MKRELGYATTTKVKPSDRETKVKPKQDFSLLHLIQLLMKDNLYLGREYYLLFLPEQYFLTQLDMSLALRLRIQKVNKDGSHADSIYDFHLNRNLISSLSSRCLLSLNCC